MVSLIPVPISSSKGPPAGQPLAGTHQVEEPLSNRLHVGAPGHRTDVVSEKPGKDLVAAHGLAAGVQHFGRDVVVERSRVLENDSVRKHVDDDLRSPDLVVAMHHGVDDRFLERAIVIGRKVMPAATVFHRADRIQRRGAEPRDRLLDLFRHRPEEALSVRGVAVRFVMPIEHKGQRRPRGETAPVARRTTECLRTWAGRDSRPRPPACARSAFRASRPGESSPGNDAGNAFADAGRPGPPPQHQRPAAPPPALPDRRLLRSRANCGPGIGRRWLPIRWRYRPSAV